jgi:acetyltransferase-like isoleucine patch superfamily enzyme
MTRERALAARVTFAREQRFAAGVRIGAGSIVDDDVVLGAAGADADPPVIGERAVIRRGSEVNSGVRAGDRLRTGRNVVIGEDTTLGDDCAIGHNSVVGSGCTIGDRVRIDANCVIAALTTIEDDVRVAAGVNVANDPHPGSGTQLCSRGPTLRRNAQIGAGSTIWPFVEVGEAALVEPGSVVTESVGAGVVVMGNPARVHGAVMDVRCPLDLPEGGYLTRPASPPLVDRERAQPRDRGPSRARSSSGCT